MRTVLTAALLIALATGQAAADEQGTRALPPPADRTVDFAGDVKPILERSCARCHARGRRKGGFSIESRETLLAGGDNGPALVVGDSARSELIALVAGLDPANVMPQKGSRLTPQQIGVLRAWIDQGAPWAPGVSFARASPRNLEPRRPELPETAGPERNAPTPGAGSRAGVTTAQDTHPIDRLLVPYYAEHGVTPSGRADDIALVRRTYLDVTGELPPPDAVRAFTRDRRPDRQARLVGRLLADRVAYAEHWLTFWNDLLRNDYRGTGYIDGGREQITRWLYNALLANMPFDRFVAELVDPAPGAQGFTKGIVWRGVVNASQTPEMQAAQSISQVFMGVNLKCASCHDSFVNDWQLSDAYGMAGIYADGPLEMVECDRPTGDTATARFLYPQLGDIDARAPKAARLTQLARLLTNERNGRLSRTFVNRLWARFMGRGLVEPVDDMERQAWLPDLLDWLAEDFVAHGYDVKAAIARILTSEAYQRAAVDVPERAGSYVFRGPAIRRLSAEQFVDALGAVTGVWEDAPAGDFDFTAAGTDPVPPMRGRWITAPVIAASAGAPWFARGSFSIDAVPATVHVLLGSERPYVLYINGHKAAEGSAATARMIDIRPHVQRGPNVLAVAMLAPEAGETPLTQAQAEADGLFAQVFVRQRPAASAGIRIAAASGRAWRTARTESGGWEAPGFDDREWTRAVERRSSPAPENDSGNDLARVLTSASRLGRTRAALAVADPLTTALGRPSREQVVTSRAVPATTLQALELLNGQTLADRIRRGADALVTGRRESAGALIDRVYLRALGRKPDPSEAAACRQLLGRSVDAAAVEDLLWSIVMLPEFQLIY
jgi:cytochrome c553